jgi:hypothetical protein
MCENSQGSPLSKGSSQWKYPRPRQIPFEGGVGSESLASPSDKGVNLFPQSVTALPGRVQFLG